MNPWNIEVGETNFEAEVLERSRQVPVMVDFWAPWCGPCRVLGPVLERLAEESAGAFILAKLNVDENPTIAALFQIQGIPAVKIFKDGALAGEFTGALPEEAIRQVLSRFLLSDRDKRVREGAERQEEGDRDQAEAIYREVLEQESDHSGALFHLGRLLADRDETQALNLLERISLVAPERKEAEPLIARLKLKKGGGEDLSVLRQEVTRTGDDLEARFKLGQALAASDQYEEALEEFLTVVKRDREFRDDGARKAILQIFDILGNESAIVDCYRSELAKALFK